MAEGQAKRWGEATARVLASAQRAVPTGAGDRITQWLSAVDEWNRKLDLTAARSDAELVDLMLADAVYLAQRLPVSALLVDVGSGAGAPGLPLALLRPDLQVSLVEPKQKRAAFLRSVLGRFAAAAGGALAAEVVQARVEQLGGRTFDAAVSRATLSPEAWLPVGAGLAPRGEVWVLLARQEPPGLEGWAVTRDERYRWPLTGARRRALCYRPVQKKGQ